MPDLRDPIWQGYAAIIAIITFVATIALKLFPKLEDMLERAGGLLTFLVVLSVLGFLAVKFSPRFAEALASTAATLKDLFNWATTSLSCLIAFIAATLVLLCLLLAKPTGSMVKSMFVTPTPTPTRTLIPTFTPTATVTPTVSPAPSFTPTPVFEVVLADNFDAGASSAWLPALGSWQMVNDQYTMTNISSSWTYGQTFAGDPNWNDYRLGVQVCLPITFSSIDNQAEIIVRAQDPYNYLALRINNSAVFAKDSAKAVWYVVADGNVQALPNAGFDVSSFSAPYYIEIETRGDIITTFVGGKQLSRWSGAPFLQGNVGLAINSRNANNPAAFDNFSVTLVSQQGQ